MVRPNIWQKIYKLGIRGKLFNVIMSMYEDVTSRVKLMSEREYSFECLLGVRQGECLSPFLFAIYLNDLEDELMLKGAEGINVNTLKIFLLMYADDIVMFSKSPTEMQKN